MLNRIVTEPAVATLPSRPTSFNHEHENHRREQGKSRFSLAGHPQVVELLCPHCLKEATFNIKSWTQHAGRVAAAETPCPRCNIEVLFLNLTDHRDSPGEPTLHMHPDPVGRDRMDGAEYLRAFLFGRLGWSQLNAMLIISGAFGLFRKDIDTFIQIVPYHYTDPVTTTP